MTVTHIPDGFTDKWDSTLWSVGHVFRWSAVYSAWLDCEAVVTVKPNMTIKEAFERCMGEPMWPDYAVFFVFEN